jgi:hypothetical protein
VILTQFYCGLVQSDMRLFYCPAIKNVYIDLGLNDELKGRLGPLSARLELQAGRCLIERSNVKSGMQAVAALSDDQIQRMARRINRSGIVHLRRSGSNGSNMDWRKLQTLRRARRTSQELLHAAPCYSGRHPKKKPSIPFVTSITLWV